MDSQTISCYLLALALSGPLVAQSEPPAPASSKSRHMDITGATEEPPIYTPPTAADRWRYLYSNALSPAALATHLAAAGFSHAIDSVPDWGHGVEGVRQTRGLG